MRRIFPITAVAAIVLGAGVLAGCGGGDDSTTATGQTAGGGDGGTLVVYSGRSEELVGPVYERFEKATGIDLDVRYGESVDLALLLGEEGDRSPADVFVSQSPGSVAYLAGRDLLSELPAETLERVAPRFRDPDGRWVGITGRQRVLVYNTDLVTDPSTLPTSVLDLTKPEFKGKVGVAPSNASFQDFVTAMRQIAGEDETKAWLEGMAANDAKAYAKNGAIVEAVARGEIPYGLVNHYYIAEAKEDDPDVPIAAHRFAGTDVGSLFLISTASIPEASDDRAGAVRLIDFMLGKESQEFFASAEFEYPVAAGVKPAAEMPALDTLEVPEYDLGNLEDLRQTATLISESGIGN